ncbi:unnamed protein product, partial [Pocillopora meandrina]
PSQPPTAFQLTASSSTSITASWQLPPVFARHRNITGFKLFYKKKSSGGSATTLPISDGRTSSKTVSGLDKFTEYEFQVLASTSDGDGPKSSVKNVNGLYKYTEYEFQVLAFTSAGDGAIHTQEVAGLDKYTEYEFQVLAFTSVGDGPNSTAIF